jgi:hypothetical protein
LRACGRIDSGTAVAEEQAEAAKSEEQRAAEAEERVKREGHAAGASRASPRVQEQRGGELELLLR